MRFIHSGFLRSTILVLVLLLNYLKGNCQITISGPSCVVPNIIYQYDINVSEQDTSKTMTICVTGGKIIDTSSVDSCVTYTSLKPFVKIAWNSGESHFLRVSDSTAGNILYTDLTSDLKSGQIDTTLLFQEVNSSAIPSTLSCSDDSGGSCAPVYNYHWEQSDDGLTWHDIETGSGSSKNLVFSAPLLQTTYFRREVSETHSNTVAYSQMAVISIVINSTP
ncbi:MAG: hypothetical protein QM802_20700 [Agriterribacter sp.]